MVYVASSWRNTERLDLTVQILRQIDGVKIYDFREDDSFHWSDIDLSIQKGSGFVSGTDAKYMINALKHPKAVAGHKRDMDNLNAASTLVLCLPCGKSAHTEYGYALASGKHTIVYLENPVQPELMYSGATFLEVDLKRVEQAVRRCEFKCDLCYDSPCTCRLPGGRADGVRY